MSRAATDVSLTAGAFLSVTALAELFGAANMGTAMAFGVIAFAFALVAVLLRG